MTRRLDGLCGKERSDRIKTVYQSTQVLSYEDALGPVQCDHE
jgi:hypothetical protein